MSTVWLDFESFDPVILVKYLKFLKLKNILKILVKEIFLKIFMKKKI